jgi:hypothetical protein
MKRGSVHIAKGPPGKTTAIILLQCKLSVAMAGAATGNGDCFRHLTATALIGLHLPDFDPPIPLPPMAAKGFTRRPFLTFRISIK